MDARLSEDTTMTDNPPGFAPTRPNEDEALAQVQSSPGEYAEEYPAYCRLLQDIPDIPRYNVGKGKLSHMPNGDQDSGWQNCLTSVEKYDRELCQAYREQIDTLLVFGSLKDGTNGSILMELQAGLFSAVVTAFAVESYQWLQEDPIDTSAQLLREVVILLSQNSNRTVPPAPSSAHQLSGAAIVRINSCWFLSLSLSLSAALVGILCKQWLREFERNVSQSPETALAVRHVRFQGFEFWKVGSIVTSVPIIMQIALAFFIVGIIELLWHLDTIVACCVSVIAGLTLSFYLATTLLPVAQYACICMRCYLRPLRSRDYSRLQAFTEPQCAFKSAQAWLAFRVAQPIINRLLKANGYQFSSGRPPAFFERILRPADSWVDFDLNWIKCRDDIHTGPRCAFESLAWIAGNLGELNMSSWIWHCVWARWLKAGDHPDPLRVATTEIASVARSYPSIVALDNSAPLVRSQALIFQCSLRTDLPVNTALELLLRVTDASGATSRWTQEALNAVRVLYHGLSIRVSDDVSRGLFRLAELQTQAILLEPGGMNSAARVNGALGFMEIAVILQAGSRLRHIFIPAMCGLVLQWLRSNPPELIAEMGVSVFEDAVGYLVSRGYRGAALHGLRRCHGIMFIAKLAGAVAERWPNFPREAYPRNPDSRRVLLELLDMFSAGFPELAPDHSNGGTGPLPGTPSAAEEEWSSPPVSDRIHLDTHASGEAPEPEPPGPLDHAGDESQPPPREHLCIDVHVGAESEAAKSANSPASRVTSPVAAASSPSGAISAGPRGMSVAEQRFEP